MTELRSPKPHSNLDSERNKVSPSKPLRNGENGIHDLIYSKSPNTRQRDPELASRNARLGASKNCKSYC